MSDSAIQSLFRQTTHQLKIDKKLHPHLFRHTAGTQLNQIAGLDITQQVLGHGNRTSTKQYTHLNPDQYAVYMKQHPYMQL